MPMTSLALGGELALQECQEFEKEITLKTLHESLPVNEFLLMR